MSAHPKLAPQRTALQVDFAVRLPQDIREALARMDIELAASRLIDRALKAEQFAPDFVDHHFWRVRHPTRADAAHSP